MESKERHVVPRPACGIQGRNTETWLRSGNCSACGTRVTLLLFADDVVLFTARQADLRHAVQRLTAGCEVVSMPLSSSRSPAGSFPPPPPPRGAAEGGARKMVHY